MVEDLAKVEIKPVVVTNLEDLRPAYKSIEQGNYTPIFVNGIEQLILAKNGRPAITYTFPNLRKDMDYIENYLGLFNESKHLVMLYDNKSVARNFEFRYLKDGLLKREQCQYIIPEDDIENPDTIKKQMEEFGIDTSYYLSDDCLKIVKIPSPTRNPDGFKLGCKSIFDALVQDSKIPVRMVIHVKYQFGVKELSEHADFEDFVEKSISEFPGSILCNHYVGGYYSEEHQTWVGRMIETHDSVFVISKDPMRLIPTN